MSAKSLLSRPCFALAALASLVASPRAQAQVVTFTDRTSFNQAASNLTTINFNDQVAAGQLTRYPNATVTLQGVTFTSNSGTLFAIDPGFNRIYGLGDGPVLTFQGTFPRLMTVTLPTGVTAFGFDYGSFGGVPFTFTLSSGEVFTLGSSATGSSTPAIPTFFGVTAIAPITSFTVSADGDGPQIDRFSFGPTKAAVVASPEPGTIALLLTATVPVVGLMRRRKKVAATA